MSVNWDELEETDRETEDGEKIYLKEFTTQRRAVVVKTCPRCGNKEVKRKDTGTEYCSLSCSKKDEMEERNQEGENNPNWKGGVSDNPYRYKERQMEKNPEKIKARKKLYNAIRTGKIERKPCEVCGSDDTHGHHEDYDKPLDVVWLCRKHHNEYHRGDYDNIDKYLSMQV